MKKISELSLKELESALVSVLDEMHKREFGSEPKRFLITPTNCFVAFVTVIASLQVYFAFID